MDIETLHSDILTALPSNPITQAHVSDTAESQWSVDKSSFLRLDQHIYIPDVEDLRLRVLRNKHDHPISSHYGQNRTMDLIRREYIWPGIRTMVKDYIRSCTTCTRSKAPCHHPYGLLKQLPILEKPWNSISMDFIEQLPLSSGFTAILVIVDQLSKQSLLPLAEFAYKNAPSATTRVSPFFTNKGYHPNISVYPECDMTSARACEYAVNLDSLHQYLREEMTNAQLHYQGLANTKRSLAPDFKVSDQVYMKAKYFWSTRPSKKLSEKNLRPYPIIAQVGSLSFTLRLPDAVHAVHLVFHVSKLELAIPNTIPNRTQPSPPPVEVDGKPEFKISEILDSKIDCRHKTCKLLYLVRWSSYKGTNKETLWLLATELGNATELLDKYHSRYLDKPGPMAST